LGQFILPAKKSNQNRHSPGFTSTTFVFPGGRESEKKLVLPMKAKILLFGILLCAGVINAQLSITFGGKVETLIAKSKKYDALASIQSLISGAGGNPYHDIPKNIFITVPAPMVHVNYRVYFGDDIHMLIHLGTSVDFEKTFQLAGTFAANGKTYPYPDAFNIGLKGFKKFPKGWLLGAEIAFDNQKSDVLIKNSNITTNGKALLQQVSDDLNMLKSPIQFNGIAGWETTKHNRFDLFAMIKPGYVGGIFGLQIEGGFRYYFKKKTNPYFQEVE
jgi:hypothetical protein